jgi:hypothetical protein
MMNRRLRDFGLNPVIGYVLSLALFAGFSVFLFSKTGYAVYIYLSIPVFLSFNLSEVPRNDFLRRCFSDKKYKMVRILENGLVAVPFIAFLLYKQCFLATSCLVGIITLCSLVNTRAGYSFVLPTPFSRRPFEFTVGFRNTFYLFLASYCLTAIAISVDNFNLGVFALLLIYLTAGTYYTKLENEYYVWSYSLSPVRFLVHKMKTGLVYSSMLSLPVLLFLGIFYPQNTGILLLFALSGYLFILLMLSAKYAAYPNEINVLQIILIIISLSFPPLFILIIPYFSYQSINKLNKFLK